MEHFPGPWRAEGNAVKAVSHGQWFVIAHADGRKLTDEANEVHARLIAAAPELLDALRDIVASCHKWAPSIDCSRGRAVLARLK